MNLGKAIAYFAQLAEMMAPVRAGGEVVKGEGAWPSALPVFLPFFSLPIRPPRPVRMEPPIVM